MIHLVDHGTKFKQLLAAIAEQLQCTLTRYDDGLDFFRSYQSGPLGCVIVNVNMPGMSGLEFQQRLPDTDPTLPVIFVSEKVGVNTAVHAMKLGAFSVLEQPYSPYDLESVIHEAIEHCQKLRQNASGLDDLRRRMESLTSDEQAVLERLVAGDPNKRIARRLDMGLRTVELRRASIMKKLEAKSLAEVVKLATIFEVIENRLDTLRTPND